MKFQLLVIFTSTIIKKHSWYRKIFSYDEFKLKDGAKGQFDIWIKWFLLQCLLLYRQFDGFKSLLFCYFSISFQDGFQFFKVPREPHWSNAAIFKQTFFEVFFLFCTGLHITTPTPMKLGQGLIDLECPRTMHVLPHCYLLL